MPEFEYVDSIDSTNNELKRRLADGTEVLEYHVISADEQTAGRGRSGHAWASPKGSSIATSMVVYPKGIDEGLLPRLVIPAALAVCQTIEDLCGIETQIKWINDVLINNKKICGILTERVFTGEAKEPAVIIGIGINLRVGSYPKALSYMASSIEEEIFDRRGNEICSAREFVENLWENFICSYEQFLKYKTVSVFMEEYNKRLVNIGKVVKVVSGKDEFEAVSKGADEEGRLVVVQGGKDIICVDSGEVHVRGLYGYV